MSDHQAEYPVRNDWPLARSLPRRILRVGGTGTVGGGACERPAQRGDRRDPRHERWDVPGATGARRAEGAGPRRERDRDGAADAVGGIGGLNRARKGRTNRRAVASRPAPGLVERKFSASGPDELWVADITYMPRRVGFRCIGGWYNPRRHQSGLGFESPVSFEVRERGTERRAEVIPYIGVCEAGRSEGGKPSSREAAWDGQELYFSAEGWTQPPR